MADEQVTEKQHFVPRFYLRQFAGPDGNIQNMLPAEKKILNSRPSASVSYESFFYGVKTGVKDDLSQSYEKMFSDMESGIADALPATIERLKIKAATDDDFQMLAMFMSSQWLRTMYFRERLNASHVKMLRGLLAISSPEHVRAVAAQVGKELTDEEIKRLDAGELAIELSNLSHLHMIDAPRIWMFADMLYCKQWSVIRAQGELRFITSDNPVAEWSPAPKGIYGVGFVERKHYFPLTPEVLLECVGPGLDAPLEPPKASANERVQYRSAGDDETLMFDMLLAELGGKYCYAPRQIEFTALLDELKKPTKATQLYRERYP